MTITVDNADHSRDNNRDPIRNQLLMVSNGGLMVDHNLWPVILSSYIVDMLVERGELIMMTSW